MHDATSAISQRKLEHLELSLTGDVDGPSSAGWDDVRLVHDCLPELDLHDIDLSTSFLGTSLRAPLWITSMTGGHERAAVVNARLARVAQTYGIAMGVGSQRAALASGELSRTYESARQAAPQAVLLANIGAPQLVQQGKSGPLAIAEIQRLIDSIQAQGLALHLNFLQEVVQPEGDGNARGCLAAIAEVVSAVSVPVMVKETGAGISGERARNLCDVGVAAIDVGGSGGTSMTRIEGLRGSGRLDGRSRLAATFDSWGIPTAASVIETRSCNIPIIATGGVRTGLDAARAIALGAHAVGVGRPFLQAAVESESALESAVETFLDELRTSLFLTGCRRPADLQQRGAVILGDLRAWSEQRTLVADR